jgi:hypothetical protein
MRSSPNFRRRIDRKYSGFGSKDVGLGGDWLASDRYRRRSGIVGLGVAIHRDTLCRDKQRGDRNDY